MVGKTPQKSSPQGGGGQLRESLASEGGAAVLLAPQQTTGRPEPSPAPPQLLPPTLTPQATSTLDANTAVQCYKMLKSWYVSGEHWIP